MNGLGNGILGRHFKECYNGVYVGGHFPRLAVWLRFISVGALGACSADCCVVYDEDSCGIFREDCCRPQVVYGSQLKGPRVMWLVIRISMGDIFIFLIHQCGVGQGSSAWQLL